MKVTVLAIVVLGIALMIISNQRTKKNLVSLRLCLFVDSMKQGTDTAKLLKANMIFWSIGLSLLVGCLTFIVTYMVLSK